MRKKILIGVLSAVMVLAMMPTMAFAGSKDSCTDNPCNHEAAIGTTHYDTIQEAIDASSDGDTIELLKNVSFVGSDDEFININKSITLDGKGYTISGYGYRGNKKSTIEINQLNPNNNINVVIKNVTIQNDADGGRPIETRGDDYSEAMVKSLTLDNVRILAKNGASNGITVGNWHDDTMTLSIKDSTIKACYDIVVYNPVDITLDNCELDGWTCADFEEPDSSAGSYGSSITIKNGSVLTGTNKYDGEDNNYATIVGEGQITVDIQDSAVIAKAEGTSIQYAIRIDNLFSLPVKANSKVTIDGDSRLEAIGDNTALIYFADYSHATVGWDIKFKNGKYLGKLYFDDDQGSGTKLPLEQFEISGGIYSDKAAIYNSVDKTFGISNNVIEGYSVIANTDSATKTTYPWTIGHIVKFEADGKDTQKFEVKHGEYISEKSVETPSASGKTFAGWFDGDTQFLFSNPVEKSGTYTAVFRNTSRTDGNIEVKETDKEIKATSNIEKKDIPISSNESTKIENGETLKVDLIIEKVTEPKTETKDEDKELVEKTIKDNKLTLGTYLDVSLVKQLYTAAGVKDGDEVKIEETLSPVTVTLTIPENLRAEGRIYTVVRVHNGVSDILFQGKADKNWQISFDTDRFSTYAIAYTDSVINTGDSNQIMLYAGVALLALLGIGIILLKKRAAK